MFEESSRGIHIVALAVLEHEADGELRSLRPTHHGGGFSGITRLDDFTVASFKQDHIAGFERSGRCHAVVAGVAAEQRKYVHLDISSAPG